jgi:hypothetical protein
MENLNGYHRKRQRMINALLLIPAFIMGYVACYVAMTYKVEK